jgi:flagellar motor switch protein FliG
MADQQASGGEGLNKAALLMITLDKPVLAQVLKHLNSAELARLKQLYERQLKSGPPPEEQLTAFSKEFLEGGTAGPASDHFKEALVLALGPQNAERITRQDYWDTMSSRVKPEALAGLLQGERPEAIAIVLSKLPARYGADVLASLPPELRAAAVERLALSQRIPSSALDSILAAIEENLKDRPAADEGQRDAGVKRAVALLNQLDSEAAAEILEHIRTADSGRAQAIESEMFHFKNFLKLDNQVLQRILSEVPPERLALALKGVSDKDREPVFAALPEQVRKTVQQEMEERGKVPTKEVKAARAELTNLAIQMERDGKIRLRADAADLVG